MQARLVELDVAKESAKLKVYEEYSEETDNISVKSRHWEEDNLEIFNQQYAELKYLINKRINGIPAVKISNLQTMMVIVHNVIMKV